VKKEIKVAEKQTAYWQERNDSILADLEDARAELSESEITRLAKFLPERNPLPFYPCVDSMKDLKHSYETKSAYLCHDLFKNFKECSQKQRRNFLKNQMI
jgi:hypothetical protein